MRAGVDEMRIALQLVGEWRDRAAALQTWKVPGQPSCRFLGWESQFERKRKIVHLLGGDETGITCYLHEASGVLHVRRHFVGLERLSAAHAAMLEAVALLGKQEIVSHFEPKVARIDYAADVAFRSPDLYEYVHSAFKAMLPERGRVVRQVWETLYLHASDSPKSKRLARVYDKGKERRVVGGFEGLEDRQLMRVEVEQRYERADRPKLDALRHDDGKALMLDRLGCVGRGTVVLKGGLVDPLRQLLDEGKISEAQFERLYSFLDLCRMGLAEVVYRGNRNLYLARAREARKLGLEVPNDERPLRVIEDELDVRALVSEVAERV